MRFYKIFIPLFLVLTVFTSMIIPSFSTAEDISNKVLRLHILADSDSSYDQKIKLELKDYFLQNTKDIFCGETLEDNLKIAVENSERLEKICNKFLEKYKTSASVSVIKEYFDTRVYDDFTLPAGVYNSVNIKIGQGKGHNWWCIVFPTVCISACSESMSEYLTEEEMKLVSSGYSPKFKIIEIYERIKYANKKVSR